VGRRDHGRPRADQRLLGDGGLHQPDRRQRGCQNIIEAPATSLMAARSPTNRAAPSATSRSAIRASPSRPATSCRA
jgi:hypothetical protein